MEKKQRLELTWIDKDKQTRLEPRIFIEDAEKSHGDKNTKNMLIHGDNLLALKALEQEFSSQIKCIYIDPPFNTGARIDASGKEIGYEDGLEHSEWLNMMYLRLKIIHRLLSKDGVLFVHLDDNESDYCKVILDEIFQRSNFINRITIDARSPSAFSTVNPGVFKSSEYILWYAKNKTYWESRSLRIPTSRDTAYNKFILNRSSDPSNWVFMPLKIAFLQHWNEDRIQIIKAFLQDAFDKLKNKTTKEVEQFIQSNFSLYQTIKLSQVSNYLKGKLKLLTFEEFYTYCYPYFLEKCSYLYTSQDIDQFVYENSASVCRETAIDDDGAGRETVELKYESLNNPTSVLKLERGANLDIIYILNGSQISFYDKNVQEIEGQRTATKILTNVWTDISWEGIASEGGIKFKKGKKPEKLLKRCIELTTDDGDLVLDSFLGSGTTVAVAQKLRRRWIGIELGEHCHTHCLPRLTKVVDGKDMSGISKAANWQGGGGFKYYYLAPSLLKADKYGNWVIDERYKPEMLAAAMAKQEGFKYSPDDAYYWKQGRSTEKDYIFTTTNLITVEHIDKIHDEMQQDESLLICCKSFQKACETRYPNITIKKIPKMLLGRCEFGKDDYSLNIVNMPVDADTGGPDDEPSKNRARKKSKKVRTAKAPDLFGGDEEE